jgi:hypothetical protein
MDELVRPQVFWARTKTMPPGSHLHYHIDRHCHGRPGAYERQEKTMCHHCLVARNNQMQILRLVITRPYAEQQMRLQILRNRGHTTQEAEMLLRGPIAFGGLGD